MRQDVAHDRIDKRNGAVLQVFIVNEFGHRTECENMSDNFVAAGR